MNITDEQWNDVSDALYEEMQLGINPMDERDKLKAHAAQLAEALRDALKYADSATEHPENKAAFRRIITQALAAWSKANEQKTNSRYRG